MAAAALAMAGAASVAYAGPADQFSQQDDFTPQPNQIGPRPPHRTLQWNSKTGRWGINFEMTQPQD
ncbi:MAG: NtrZ family periplasmic regulatory protein, partial [Caulobacteraceae bacterium]